MPLHRLILTLLCVMLAAAGTVWLALRLDLIGSITVLPIALGLALILRLISTRAKR